MIETRCPADTVVTSGPTSTTWAENSCPSTWGSRAPLSGCGSAGMTIGPIAYSCRSVPQIPHHSGRTSTSPAPGGRGSDTSSTRTSCSPWKTAAFISSLQARVDEDLAVQPPGGQPVELLGHRAERMDAVEQLRRQRRAGEQVKRRREILAAHVGKGGPDADLPHHQRVDVDLLRCRRDTDLQDGAAGPGQRDRGVELARRAAGLDHDV